MIVQDSPSHRALDCDNGFLTDEKRRLAEAYQYLVSHVDRLVAMRAASGEFARMNLDYRMLAQRVCT